MAQVTTLAGVTVTDQMSPTERFNAIAKSLDITLTPMNARAGFGPPLHVHASPTGGGVVEANAAPDTIGGKAPPPPRRPEVANKPGPQGAPSKARQAEVDAEQQAAGLQARPDGRFLAAGEFDQEAFDLLTERYKALVKPLYGKTDETHAAAASRFKAAYENDVKSLYDGRQLTGAEIAQMRKGTGKVDTFVPFTKAKEQPAAPQEHPPEAWAETHVSVADKEGWIPLNRINAAGLSGYTLPKFVSDQTYHVSIFQDLANARKQGISQKQVEGFIRDGMVQSGVLKQ